MSHENQTPGPKSSVEQLQSKLTDLLAFANTSPVLTEQTRKRTRILTPDESPAAMKSDNLADLDIPQHTKEYIETAIVKELDLRNQPFLQLIQEQQLLLQQKNDRIAELEKQLASVNSIDTSPATVQSTDLDEDYVIRIKTNQLMRLWFP